MTDPNVFTRAEDQVWLRRTMRLGHLWALIDACDIPDIAHVLLPLRGKQAACLYDGTPEQNDWAIGGWIVRLDEGLLQWVRDTLPRDSWGILLESRRTLPELLQHFQQFVKVQTPDGKALFFRFYDPRVLPLYLEHAPPLERRAFCTGIVRLGGWDAEELLTWWHDPAPEPAA